MKSIRVMSVIAIILFSLHIVSSAIKSPGGPGSASDESDFLRSAFAISLGIVGVANTGKKKAVA